MIASAIDLESLWGRYNKRITGYIVKRIMDRDVTEDLVSNVFLRVCVASANGNGCNENESGWLFQIARSVIWDYLRAKRRGVFVSLDDCEERVDPFPQPEEAIEQKIHSEYVRDMIAQLSDLQAWAITLRLEGYENDEIAELSGRGVESIRALHTRGYAKLREMAKEAA